MPMQRSRPVLTVLVAALSLAACGREGAQDPSRALHEARDALAIGLPAPYVEDLVIASVGIEGDALGQRIVSPEGRAGPTRDHPQFEDLRQTERQDLQLLCARPEIQALAGTGARLVRRFVDREGELFFEVELPASACASAAP